MEEKLPGRQLMFGELLEHLSRQGFSIGVDSHLRLHKLLSRVSGDSAPHDLRTLLAPLFVSNKKQQQVFYRIFDDFIQTTRTRPTPGKEAEAIRREEIRSDKVPFWARLWPYIIAAILVTGIVVWAAYYREKQARWLTESVTDPTPEPTPVSENNPPPLITVSEPAPELIQAMYWLAIFGPPIFLLLYEWYLYNRRRLLIRTLRSGDQPYVLPVRPESRQSKLFDSEQFYGVARQLRVRQQTEFHQLNIQKTIDATIKSFGFPTFRFKRSTRIPEYLMLIERTSQRDHQSRLFAELVKSLKNESVDVELYYFDDDPRICFKLSYLGDDLLPLGEAERKKLEFGVYLQELLRPDENRRLIFFSSGKSLVNPLTGEPEEWTTILRHWKQRALLTPVSPGEWGRREFTLSKELLLAPATMDGFQSLVDYFELGEVESLRRWIKKAPALPPSDLDAPDLVKSLRDYLGYECFQWLCACAIYPRLQWDLTLHIGGLPCMPPNLINGENLLLLFRLEWFQTKVIPEHVRQQLIPELDPEIDLEVRKAIVELISDTRPKSLEVDQHPLNVAVPRAFFEEHREKLKTLLRTLPRTQVTRDVTLARFLESHHSRFLDLVLPRALLKLFFPHGNSALRMRTSARVVLALLLMFSLWLVAPKVASAIKTKDRLIVEVGPEPTPSVFPSPLPSGSVVPSPSVISSPRLSTSPISRPDLTQTPTPIATPTSTPLTASDDLVSDVTLSLRTMKGQKPLGQSILLRIRDDKGGLMFSGRFGGGEEWVRGSLPPLTLHFLAPIDFRKLCGYGIAITLEPLTSYSSPPIRPAAIQYTSVNAFMGTEWAIQAEAEGLTRAGRRVTLLSRSRTYTVIAGRTTFIAFPCGL